MEQAVDSGIGPRAGARRSFVPLQSAEMAHRIRLLPEFVAANELAPVILERVINLTTVEKDLVCDPFAGGGVTAYVAERLGRRWIVGDINDCDAVKERLVSLEQGFHPEWRSSKGKSLQKPFGPGPVSHELLLAFD